MSLQIALNTPKEIVIRPAESITTETLEVERIVEEPSERAVYVFIKFIGRVKVTALSNDNYDNPEWTNDTLAAALRAQFA